MTIEISSTGLSPSNRGAWFPNLARATPASEEVVVDVSATCRRELEAAGIEPVEFGSVMSGEVPTKIMGQIAVAKWGFQRAWYYWVAKGPGLPPEIADRLHAAHGRTVRVDGHCGCPSPREWFKGFAVGCYHVDGPEGLKALADALRTVKP